MWAAAYTEEFAKSLCRLDMPTKRIVGKRIRKVLENPQRGKPILGEPDTFAERFGHYRMIYRIKPGRQVIFVRVGKRDAVYRSYD